MLKNVSIVIHAGKAEKTLAKEGRLGVAVVISRVRTRDRERGLGSVRVIVHRPLPVLAVLLVFSVCRWFVASFQPVFGLVC